MSEFTDVEIDAERAAGRDATAEHMIEMNRAAARRATVAAQDERRLRQAAAGRSLSAWFVSAIRSSGETFVKLDDGAPEWLSDAVREAHGDESPDDWCYDRLQSIACRICDGADESWPIADQLTDVYNADLCAWLSGNLYRAEFVDEFMENYGWTTAAGWFAAMRGGQFLQLDAMASVMLGAVVSAHESYVDECEAEELEAHTLPMWLVHGMPAGPL